jgi:hypothetical protein
MATRSAPASNILGPARAVTSIAASRIAKGPRLQVPIDLALRVSGRKQAEIL